MKKQTSPERFFLSLSIFIFILSSCSQGGADKTEATSSTSDSNTIIAPQVASGDADAPLAFGGKIHSLWTERSFFRDSTYKGKLVFSFVFTGGTPTLHGWDNINSGGHDFPDKPDIILSQGTYSPISFSDETYFGNMVLKPLDIKKIKDYLRTNADKYVVFLPYFDTDGKHIIYKIGYTSDDPNTANLADPKIAPLAGVELNPSPPKNYN